MLHAAAALVVFDLDGTLVDSVPDLAAALNRRLADRRLPRLDEARVKSFVGDGAAALVSRALAASGGEETDEDLPAFLADYEAHAAERTRLYPGAIAALDRLAADGRQLAICTNKPLRATHALLDALRLTSRFAAICGGDSLPIRKPDPAALLATIGACNAVPERSLMAGDLAHDITAARGAGLRSIHARWGYGPMQGDGADAAAGSFAELPSLVDRLLGR